MAWQGRILRVDLTRGTCTGEPLNMDWAQQYLGQRGLASRYLQAEMDAAADPLSPANKLIFATGPLTGTPAPTGGRWSVVTKGALTDAIAASNSGGYFGAELKFAGWDMIIFEGRAETPVYLYLEDDRAELLDAAADLWGKSVWDTEAWIRARHQDPQIRIASIGRAGEIGVRYACVVNDRDRAAGRSGVGAVMGSKNLKAVAVRGTRGVVPADPAAFAAAVAAAKGKLQPHPARARLAKGGTMPMMDVTNEFGSLPTRNCRDVQFENTSHINAAKMTEVRASDHRANLITNKACFGCTIGCGRVSRIDPSHFSVQGKDRYLAAGGGLEYESGFAFGPMCGVDDLEAATFANFVCNEHSMDPISLGGTVAAAMELFETGVITTEHTHGVDFSFGSAEALVRGAEWAASGEGFGADLGLGAKRLCDKYGHPEFFMGVKGQEFPGYDPRAMQGMGLAYATSNRGACHMRASPYAADFAKVGTDGRAQVVMETQHRAAAVDSTGMCAFAGNALSLGDYAAQVAGAVGGAWDEARMMEIGERIWNVERLFNLAAGLTAADDTLPARLLKDAAKTGAGKGWVNRLDVMLPEYYALRGWDENGVPRGQTLTRLGLG
ncbi:MAG: aldehyde ferredoxin oxidoreductase family protein [Hyphomicrobiales bacterium]|nr:aldehyde ferredoxin oxidoreductase family protein [Hyphomicrobiales bacterium]